MEIFLQWLDELDDVAAIVAAQRERVRRLCVSCLVAALALSVLAAAALLALAKPLLAPVLGGLLLLSILYRRQLQSSQTTTLIANG